MDTSGKPDVAPPKSNGKEYRRSAVENLFNYLNEKAGRNFQHTDANLGFMTARLKGGATLKQMPAGSESAGATMERQSGHGRVLAPLPRYSTQQNLNNTLASLGSSYQAMVLRRMTRPRLGISRERASEKSRPHNVQAEQSVLGGLMLDNRAWDEIADLLHEEDFYRRGSPPHLPGHRQSNRRRQALPM
ncbi:MAG: DnaB-like helicase N-terminal domain-containing protein [Gammaproteobacteria bacterium]|nr:DnaB-like helicase N-terminal domain-containing protein [Gammaproteobacteria bacterium]